MENSRLVIQPQLTINGFEPLMVDGDDVFAVSAQDFPRTALDPDRLIRIMGDLLVRDALVYVTPLKLDLLERKARRMHVVRIVVVREAEA